jgi:hypothetical protein
MANMSGRNSPLNFGSTSKLPGEVCVFQGKEKKKKPVIVAMHVHPIAANA